MDNIGAVLIPLTLALSLKGRGGDIRCLPLTPGNDQKGQTETFGFKPGQEKSIKIYSCPLNDLIRYLTC